MRVAIVVPVQLLLLLGPSLVRLTAAVGKDWALLFTGAHGWRNYPSHSDLCHGYHVLHNAGIPDERIVVIMYGDVADSRDNPYPGKLFNNYTRIDVKQGCPLDYHHTEVSADLILAVLKGDDSTVKILTGRVGKMIKSGPEDNIFVAVSDHGGPRVLMMPDGRRMTSKQIMNTLFQMHAERRYAKLVFYLESCESGSIFSNLAEDLNVYALTSSGASTPSYQNYCDDPEFPNVCLGGQFSCGWTESAEVADLKTYTLRDHALAIRKAVNKSSVHVYGDTRFMQMPLKIFFGGQSKFSQTWVGVRISRHQRRQHIWNPNDLAPYHLVPYTLLKRRLMKSSVGSKHREELEARLVGLQDKMTSVDRFFYTVAKLTTPEATDHKVRVVMETKSAPVYDWNCYESAMEEIRLSCSGLLLDPDIEGYVLSKFNVLVNLCESQSRDAIVQGIIAAAKNSSYCYE